jgi:transcription antitermination factor NusG
MDWLVLRTKPRQEKIATSHLAERGVEPYCPMFQQPPWHPRAPRGPMPLFPGYLFVLCEVATRLNAVRFCPGVLQPVSFGDRLAFVEQAVIDALRLREGERGYLLAEEQERGFAAGDNVRVMAGPLTGLEGVFRGYLRGRERARVFMEFLRSRHVVEVESDALALVRR